MIGIRSLQFRYRHSSTAIVPAFGAGILGRQNEKAPGFTGAFPPQTANAFYGAAADAAVARRALIRAGIKD